MSNGMRAGGTVRFWFFIIATCPSLASWSYGLEPRREGQEDSISRAVFAGGHVWLLSDAGELSRIRPGDEVRVDAGLPEPALDICVSGSHVKVLTCKRTRCKKWKVRTWIDGRWLAGTVLLAEGDDFVALTCGQDGDIVLTDRRMIEVQGGKQVVVPLAPGLGDQLVKTVGSVVSTHVTADHVFVGINVGEWGGGVKRIDRETGEIAVIEKNTTGELCGGPLNSACDPVTGIAEVPWKAECLAIAIGLVHFSPHGRIVELCKDEVRSLYFKSAGDVGLAGREEEDEQPFRTVAFFGLVRVGDELIAAGTDGVYRFESSGEPKMGVLPRFESIGGIGVSFDIPDVVLVLTGINQRRSISGNVPLLVAR